MPIPEIIDEISKAPQHTDSNLTNKLGSSDSETTENNRFENIDQHEVNMTVLMWIGTLFFWFVPGFIGLMLAKPDGLCRHHSIGALNFSITILIVLILSAMLSFVGIGLLMYIAGFIWALVVCIKGVITAREKHEYHPMLCIEFLK